MEPLPDWVTRRRQQPATGGGRTQPSSPRPVRRDSPRGMGTILREIRFHHAAFGADIAVGRRARVPPHRPAGLRATRRRGPDDVQRVTPGPGRTSARRVRTVSAASWCAASLSAQDGTIVRPFASTLEAPVHVDRTPARKNSTGYGGWDPLVAGPDRAPHPAAPVVRRAGVLLALKHAHDGAWAAGCARSQRALSILPSFNPPLRFGLWSDLLSSVPRPIGLQSPTAERRLPSRLPARDAIG